MSAGKNGFCLALCVFMAGLNGRMYPFPDGPEINLIIEDSDVWLYCEVNSARTLTVMWTRVFRGAMYPLSNDPPHVILRNHISHGNSTTSLLITANIQENDSGSYQCSAEDGGGDSVLMGVVLLGTVIAREFGLQTLPFYCT